MTITQTPMRITLAGGGTDVYWYSRIRGGDWISAAINKYVYVLVNEADDPEQIDDPIIKQCLLKAGVKKNIRISVVSEVSGRSGLGGSGAFEVGLLNALYTFRKKTIPPIKLAEQATFIETKKLKKPIGPQDQYITALGGIKHFKIDKKGQVFVENLNLTKETISKLQTNLLFFSTGINRDAETVLGDQKKKAQENINTSKVIQSLDEIKELGKKVKEFLLNGQVDEFGKSLHEHWLIKKRLSEKVSNSKIDEWYNLGLEAGALGGKIMGAGGGGWFVFYVNKNRDKFVKKMAGLNLIPQIVNFDWEGTKLLT